MGRGELYALEGFESGQAGHVLVKDDEVEVLLSGKLKGIGAAACGDNVIAFAFEEHYVGFEEVDLVVGPEYG